MNRREWMLASGAWVSLGAVPQMAVAAGRRTRIGAAWRGPRRDDRYFAGVLVADWEDRRLAIQYAVQLPGRPHDVAAEADGGLLVSSYRFGDWLLRCDGTGKVMQ